MGKVKQEAEDLKSQLVSEICSMSTRSVGCVHKIIVNNRCSQSSSKSHFIDWYRLLGVEESSGIDVIRKKYHKLALQLHPDKNKHPKAEIAFKLVSEVRFIIYMYVYMKFLLSKEKYCLFALKMDKQLAYVCLTDHAKRRAFDLERWKNFCFQCNTIPYTSKISAPPTTKSNAFAQKGNATNWSRSYKILRGLKDMKDRFRDEAKVIENCLRTNAASKKESSLFSPSDYMFRSNSQKESPVFNPSDYVFQGYPHLRTRIQKKPDRFCYLQAGHFVNCEPRTEYFHDSPIFEVRSESASFRSKSACVYS
ncbi:hypothetical protein FEM48_Zijuj12G0196700 [Ziziphus jujuba var. spinosa]|uniref:J domain-containing protein n=1 Tax=Ziziphus jujuba var. spinosa TaxID=714518 RepID=A0A978UF64_ZIZJJ|nr:hypothetical protein FEM48_Zijuj12G0196700 [Ziziphus jujuba var. spinosa]